jgi:hypothetical protein
MLALEALATRDGLVFAAAVRMRLGPWAEGSLGATYLPGTRTLIASIGVAFGSPGVTRRVEPQEAPQQETVAEPQAKPEAPQFQDERPRFRLRIKPPQAAPGDAP